MYQNWFLSFDKCENSEKWYRDPAGLSLQLFWKKKKWIKSKNIIFLNLLLSNNTSFSSTNQLNFLSVLLSLEKKFHMLSHLVLTIALWCEENKLWRKTFPFQGLVNVSFLLFLGFLSHILTICPWEFERKHFHHRVESAPLCLFRESQYSDLGWVLSGYLGSFHAFQVASKWKPGGGPGKWDGGLRNGFGFGKHGFDLVVGLIKCHDTEFTEFSVFENFSMKSRSEVNLPRTNQSSPGSSDWTWH
jgi:hypothetical protein